MTIEIAKPKPTDEQLEALRRFKGGGTLKVTAFAGAGKTTTLTLLAGSRTSRGTYLAFNKAIAEESKGKFPQSVDCRTTHSLAYRAVMNAYKFSSGQMTGKLRAKQLAELLDLKRRIFGGVLRLEGLHQAFLILGTVKRFCESEDAVITPDHMPPYGRLAGLPPHIADEVRAWACVAASEHWARMTNHRDSAIPLGFDGFLKLWALGNPHIASDYILMDEAQDTNPAVLGVLKRQEAQLVYVGDKHQQIYEWRGAINAMESITDCEEAYLTQSFRFGSEIAAAASKVLATLGETKPLVGTPSIACRIAEEGRVDTILARTNATVVGEAVEALSNDLKPHIVGGTAELKALVQDVFRLKKGEPASSPELFGFTSWDDVIAYAETEEGEELRMFVQLVETHGERRLWWAISSAEADEAEADVIISTAHKSKGREWNAVRLASDFMNSRLTVDDPGVEAEVRLFYVAMTRAKRLLVIDPATLEMFTEARWKERRKQDQLPVRQALKLRVVSSQPPIVPAQPVPPIVSRAPKPSNQGTQPVVLPPPTSKGREAASTTPSLWGKIARLFGGKN